MANAATDKLVPLPMMNPAKALDYDQNRAIRIDIRKQKAVILRKVDPRHHQRQWALVAFAILRRQVERPQRYAKSSCRDNAEILVANAVTPFCAASLRVATALMEIIVRSFIQAIHINMFRPRRRNTFRFLTERGLLRQKIRGVRRRPMQKGKPKLSPKVKHKR